MPDINNVLKKTSEALNKALAEKRRSEDLVRQLGPAIVENLRPVLEENSKVIKEGLSELAQAVSQLKIEAPQVDVPKAEVEVRLPEIKVPEPKVTVNVPEVKVPEIKLPAIKVPKPEVTVKVPEIKIPKTEFPKIEFPDSMRLKGIDRDNTLPVTLYDLDGQPVDLFKEVTQIFNTGGGFRNIKIGGISDSAWGSLLNPDGRLKAELPSGGSGLTDTELRAAHLDVQQLSGAVDSFNVLQLGGTSIATDSGVTGAGVQRVVHVTDVALSIRSIANSGVDIGDVDILSIAAGDNNIGDVDVRQVSGAVDSINLLQLGGTDIAKDSGVTGGGVQRIVHVTDVGLTTQTAGDVAHDAADSGNPLKIGGIARTANPTAVANSDRVNASFDDLGRQINRPVQFRDLTLTAYVSLTNGTETTLLAASAGSFHDLIYIMGANNSDAAVTVDVRPVSGGNIVMSIQVPANGTAGVATPVPYPQSGSDTGNNWTVDLPDITGTTVYISALFSREI